MPFFENSLNGLINDQLGAVRQDLSQAAAVARYGGQAKLVVAPDQVLALKQEFETIRDEVQTFLFEESNNLKPAPMGADPVSQDVANTVGQNADMAIECAWGYVNQLQDVIASLDQQARQYGLVEEANANAFRQQGA